ncbi:MAG: hypothetical protein ACM4D3_06110 [Candidatus Sericytochromatia bacterium]
MLDTNTAETTATATVQADSDAAEDDQPTDALAEDQADDDDRDMFSWSYVQKLRAESARYRERARTADHYAKRLYTELVRATGRLADPTDLAFDDEAHLEDADALAAVLD